MRTTALLIILALSSIPTHASAQDATTDAATDAATDEPAAADVVPTENGVKSEDVTLTDHPDKGRPSTKASQDRTFPGTRFWKLDKGHQEVEIWWRRRELERGKKDASFGDGFDIVQIEYEVGISDRVQLDVYENLTNRGGAWTREGTQIEARIAFDPVYDRTPLNPVLYLEWHPLHLGPARAEARLLLGQEILNDKVLAAVNLFYEQNVTKSADGMGGKTFVPNPEVGATGGASYAVHGQQLRVGGEFKLAFEKDLFSDDRWSKQLLLGPNVAARLSGEKLKLYATALFGVTDDARRFDGFLILASGF